MEVVEGGLEVVEGGLEVEEGGLEVVEGGLEVVALYAALAKCLTGSACYPNRA